MRGTANPHGQCRSANQCPIASRSTGDPVTHAPFHCISGSPEHINRAPPTRAAPARSSPSTSHPSTCAVRTRSPKSTAVPYSEAPMARPFAEVRQAMLERARAHRNPFEQADPEAVAGALDTLDSVAPEPWVAAFGALAE